MEQQHQGAGTAPDADAGSSGERAQADERGSDSTWGVGSATAMDHLRRHDFRARRSRPPEAGERPKSE